MIHAPVIFLANSRVSRVTNGNGEVVRWSGLHNFDAFTVLINVTNAGTLAGTLTLYLQDSWDSGTTWDDVVASTTITLGTTTGTQRYVVQGRIATTIAQGSAVSNLALGAGNARQGPFGDRLRLVEKLEGAAGSPVGATYTVTIIPCRSENN